MNINKNQISFTYSIYGKSAIVILVIAIFFSSCIFDGPMIAYSKKKISNDNLPTENNKKTSEVNTVLKEYTDMPIDSPVYISSHSKHFSKAFGTKSLDLNGEIKNNGTETAQFIQVILTYYNKNNVTLGSDFTYTNPDTIDPGQAAPYKINVGIGNNIPINDINHIKYHIDWN